VPLTNRPIKKPRQFLGGIERLDHHIPVLFLSGHRSSIRSSSVLQGIQVSFSVKESSRLVWGGGGKVRKEALQGAKWG